MGEFSEDTAAVPQSAGPCPEVSADFSAVFNCINNICRVGSCTIADVQSP